MSVLATSLSASCLYYDLSANGTELVTYVSMKEEAELVNKGLEERIQVFSLYGTTDYIPDYEGLKPGKAGDVKQSVDQ